MPDTRRLIPLVALLFVILACALIGSRADHEVAIRTPAICRAAGYYREATASSGVRQPIDAWSSLSPAIAGAIVLARTLDGRWRGQCPLARSRVPGVLLGIAACAIAVFSFHYHATLTWPGEWLDGVALYLLAGFPIAWAIAQARASRVVDSRRSMGCLRSCPRPPHGRYRPFASQRSC